MYKLILIDATSSARDVAEKEKIFWPMRMEDYIKTENMI
jgi:hypothetical protein